jgi:hypothetical protein
MNKLIKMWVDQPTTGLYPSSTVELWVERIEIVSEYGSTHQDISAASTTPEQFLLPGDDVRRTVVGIFGPAVVAEIDLHIRSNLGRKPN